MMNHDAPWMLSRRNWLRGLGVTLALPWLESLRVGRAFAAMTSTPPRRYAFVYTPNGYHQATFVPQATGRDWELTPALEPLAKIRDQVTLVTGLDRQFVAGTGVHAQCGACWLTSSPPHETLDGGFPTNVTLDQLLARRLGGDTRLPSLELSCNDFADNKETKYFECISWYGPGYAANVEKNPRAVFQRLFGKPQLEPTRSVLDVVLADAQALRKKLGRDDQAKLDEYLNSVRTTERRIESAESSAQRQSPPQLAVPVGIPERRGDYLRLMADLAVLAFQHDATRVATLVIDPERWDSPRMYHGVFDKPQNHHVLTHTKGDEAKAALTKIDRFHVEFFAYFVERLAAIREGDGTLLDSCCVAMGSGISDGDSHNYNDLQVLLAGRAGGNISPGRHFHFEGKRPLADLWLTLLQQPGEGPQRFADSTKVLTELNS
jgi:hypothetical protein